MAKCKNVLFIMCDQLRHDYLGCTGHPHLATPNIDRLAARGVRFSKAYVQATLCGPSRMSAYTGRYMRSHGAHGNGTPLRIGEPTLGDHLKEIGVRNVLVGKTHMTADKEGMQRLGIEPDSIIGVHVAQCGFEPYERHDGLHPDGHDPNPPYDSYLRANGFEASNPWEQWANSGEDADGRLLNGWLLVHADKPARIPEEHSETPWTTRRAMQFIREADVDGRPWCLHLSYIKPHWPYIVPAPYHDMYGRQHLLRPVRSEAERADPHPVYGAFMQDRVSQTFSRDEVRERVLPAYMGLIKQIDDQLGVLMTFLKERGHLETTMIVFTSDHGDYLGDHWLGEKEMFHDVSARVPMIVCDPDPQADATRGTVSAALVEMIDLAPTFLDYFGGAPKPHVLEGRSLRPLLRGEYLALFNAESPRVAISEFDYSIRRARLRLRMPDIDCRMVMATDGRWKYVYMPGFRPMLHDLETDPSELVDLGGDPRFAGQCQRMHNEVFAWMSRLRSRITMRELPPPGPDPIGLKYDTVINAGVLIGYWDEADLAEEYRKRDQSRGKS